jgi:hypothetical protein
MAERNLELPRREEAFQSVGQAIQAFSNVEFALTMLYATLMEPGERANAVATLDAAWNIETKCA